MIAKKFEKESEKEGTINNDSNNNSSLNQSTCALLLGLGSTLEQSFVLWTMRGTLEPNLKTGLLSSGGLAVCTAIMVRV